MLCISYVKLTLTYPRSRPLSSYHIQNSRLSQINRNTITNSEFPAPPVQHCAYESRWLV